MGRSKPSSNKYESKKIDAKFKNRHQNRKRYTSCMFCLGRRMTKKNNVNKIREFFLHCPLSKSGRSRKLADNHAAKLDCRYPDFVIR